MIANVSASYQSNYSITEVIDAIIKLNDGLAEFWGAATGWAPQEAADLMNKSRRLAGAVCFIETLDVELRIGRWRLSGSP